jgi:hypothetical protein
LDAAATEGVAMAEIYIQVHTPALRVLAAQVRTSAASLLSQRDVLSGLSALTRVCARGPDPWPPSPALVAAVTSFERDWRSALDRMSSRAQDISAAMAYAAVHYEHRDLLPKVPS